MDAIRRTATVSRIIEGIRMKFSKSVILDLAARALESGTCTLVIGSGMSLSSGMPSAESVAGNIKSDAAFEIKSNDLARVSEEYSAVYGRGQLNRLLVSLLTGIS